MTTIAGVDHVGPISSVFSAELAACADRHGARRELPHFTGPPRHHIPS